MSIATAEKVRAWSEQVGVYKQKVLQLRAELAPLGRRRRPLYWKEQDALLAGDADAPGSSLEKSTQSYEAFEGVLASLTKRKKLCDLVFEEVKSPELLAEVVRNMSGSYVEQLRLMRKATDAARVSCIKLEAAVRKTLEDWVAAYLAKNPGFAAEFVARPREIQDAELYVTLLIQIAREKPKNEPDAGAAFLLAEMGLRVLGRGGREGTRAAAPLQNLGGVPRLNGGAGPAPPGTSRPGPVYDFSLPTITPVVYDYLPLTDPKTALKFGPLAKPQTGLNHWVVQRLRTIRGGPPDHTALMIGNPGAVGYDKKRQEILVPN